MMPVRSQMETATILDATRGTFWTPYLIPKGAKGGPRASTLRVGTNQAVSKELLQAAGQRMSRRSEMRSRKTRKTS